MKQNERVRQLHEVPRFLNRWQHRPELRELIFRCNSLSIQLKCIKMNVMILFRLIAPVGWWKSGITMMTMARNADPWSVAHPQTSARCQGHSATVSLTDCRPKIKWAPLSTFALMNSADTFLVFWRAKFVGHFVYLCNLLAVIEENSIVGFFN